MSNESNTSDAQPTIIDLDPDQVVEGIDPPRPNATPLVKKPRKLALGLTSIAALLAAAVAGGWFYREVLSSYFPSDEVSSLLAKSDILQKDNAALRDQVGALERLSTQLKSDVDALEIQTTQSAVTAKSAADGLSSTAKRLDGIEQTTKINAQSLSELKRQIIQAVPADAATGTGDPQALVSLNARVETLEKDLASLKSLDGGTSTDTVVLSQSLSDLKAKFAAGAGFAPELERIQRMVPAAAGLDVLAAHAAQGIPDDKALARQLTALVEQLPKPEAAATEPVEDSLWNRAWDAVSDLIKIRDQGATDWPKSAAAAAALADAGDLPQAIEQLSTVEDAKPAGIQQWMDIAAARIASSAALQSVEQAVLRVIAAKG